MHEVLVNRLGGLSLPRNSVVRLTDRPDMTLDVYRGRKTTNQQKSTTTKKKEKCKYYTVIFKLHNSNSLLIFLNFDFLYVVVNKITMTLCT